MRSLVHTTVRCISLTALTAIFSFHSQLALAQSVPRMPDQQQQIQERMKNAEQLHPELIPRIKDVDKNQKNKYRGGAPGGFSEAKQNMEKLVGPILYQNAEQAPDFDKWYSPHLRDAMYPDNLRTDVLPYRYEAGAAGIVYIPWLNCYFCWNGVGGLQTACSVCNERPCLPAQKWKDKHIFQECCTPEYGGTSPPGLGTSKYVPLRTDANFKTCCVRDGEQREDTEKIACMHPGVPNENTGWAGVFEYYYPTTVVGWENDRTTTMIAGRDEVDACLAKTRPMMHQKNGKAADWVEKAIKKNLEVADKLGGGSTDTSSLKQNINDVIQDIGSKVPEDLQFADGLQGEGLTMRVNFPAMDRSYQEKLAKHFCMHPQQFHKLMDPAAGDKVQKEGGADEAALKRIPIWSNYCPEGVELMTDPDETLKCKNVDVPGKTDLVKGMQAWLQDPLFCQRMNLKNQKMQEYFGDVLNKTDKTGGGGQSEGSVGYTCRDGGKLNGSMVPVEMYRHAAVERRAAISDHVLGFLIAGGLYQGKMISGQRSYYKRFEPRPYSMKYPPQWQIFVGKKFEGAKSGATNERVESCELVEGNNYSGKYDGKDKSDQLFISEFTHKGVHLGKDQRVNDGVGDSDAKKDFNWYVDEWGKKSPEMPDRGLDEKSQNYGAAFRLFATCPKGWQRWHPDGSHDPIISDVCREENFGGKP